MSEKESNCLLLWTYQGGQVDEKRRMVSVPGVAASGYCDSPDACGQCPLMQQEIAKHPAGHATWVCPACLREVARKMRSKGIPVHMTGHYADGLCAYIGCTRPPRIEFDDDMETKVVIPARFSRFLQLVIGDINS